jgi:hypothetical protein
MPIRLRLFFAATGRAIIWKVGLGFLWNVVAARPFFSFHS